MLVNQGFVLIKFAFVNFTLCFHQRWHFILVLVFRGTHTKSHGVSEELECYKEMTLLKKNTHTHINVIFPVCLNGHNKRQGRLNLNWENLTGYLNFSWIFIIINLRYWSRVWLSERATRGFCAPKVLMTVDVTLMTFHSVAIMKQRGMPSLSRMFFENHVLFK